MSWRRPGVKPLSEPMMYSLLTHICATRPQWFNDYDMMKRKHEEALFIKYFARNTKTIWNVSRGWKLSALLPLQWRHNERDGVLNHRRCLLNRLLRPRSKKTPKLRVTGLCERNSPVTSEYPAQRASKTENVSIWWRHNDPWRRYDSMVQNEQWCQFIYADSIVPSAVIWCAEIC